MKNFLKCIFVIIFCGALLLTQVVDNADFMSFVDASTTNTTKYVTYTGDGLEVTIQENNYTEMSVSGNGELKIDSLKWICNGDCSLPLNNLMTGVSTLNISDEITSISQDIFDNFCGLNTINFNGTQESWRNITNGLNISANITVSFSIQETTTTTIETTTTTSEEVTTFTTSESTSTEETTETTLTTLIETESTAISETTEVIETESTPKVTSFSDSETTTTTETTYETDETTEVSTTLKNTTITSEPIETTASNININVTSTSKYVRITTSATEMTTPKVTTTLEEITTESETSQDNFISESTTTSESTPTTTAFDGITEDYTTNFSENQNISAVDILNLKKYILGASSDSTNMDYNNDDDVNIFDLIFILNKLLENTD